MLGDHHEVSAPWRTAALRTPVRGRTRWRPPVAPVAAAAWPPGGRRCPPHPARQPLALSLDDWAARLGRSPPDNTLLLRATSGDHGSSWLTALTDTRRHYALMEPNCKISQRLAQRHACTLTGTPGPELGGPFSIPNPSPDPKPPGWLLASLRDPPALRRRVAAPRRPCTA